MGDFDKAERFAIKRLYPRDFLRWLLVGLDDDLVFSRWLETQPAPFPGEPDRRCDAVAEFVSRSGTQPPWACLVEPQGQWQASFLTRLLQYLLLLHDKLRHGPHGQDRYLMTAGIVNVCEQALQSSVSWVPPGAPPGVGLTAGVWVRNVYVEDAALTLDAIAAGKAPRCLLPWVSLMAGGGDGGVIERWKELAKEEPAAPIMSSYAGLVLVFAEKRQREAIWRKALEGWKVEESLIVKEWQQAAFEKGRDEGRTVALRDALLRLVKVRLRVELPDDLRRVVEGEKDFNRLQAWLETAGVAGSIDELRDALLHPRSNGS
jgi:hypothetical protein